MPKPDTLLVDRYRLVRQVGSGGMGVVWEAWDERLERPVAVKQLRPQLGLTPEEAELGKNRAMREARITARLHHRNAVSVFDVVEHEGQPCLIMQFVPSVPLSAVLREGGPLSVGEAGRVGAQVASALAAAHRLHIVHRDVKPGNILIADDGAALISDFGIAHALGDVTLTWTGLVHGTPAFLAPEVARGAESGFASDVFSLGATVYASLEGEPPFGTDSNAIALLHKVASGDFAPPQRADVLAPVLMDMLRSDPDARPEMKAAALRLAAAVEAGRSVSPAALPLLDTEAGPTALQESDTAAPVSRNHGPSTFAAPASVVAAPSAGASSVSPSQAGRGRSGRRHRSARWLFAVALLVGLVILGNALVTGQLGRGADQTAVDPAPVRVATPAAPRSSFAPSSESSGTLSTSTSATASSSPSPAPTRTTRSPSPSRTSTPRSSEPTAAELENAITSYYALVPGNTDQAWPRMTSAYQRNHAGGRRAYQRFWDQVERVSVSQVDATPPSRVDATITYRRSGGRVVAERTSYRLVRDGDILKIADSTVLSST